MIYTTYVVALSNTTMPAAAWYFLFYLYFVFALAERKNEIQKEGKVPLRTPHVGHRVTRNNDRTYAVGIIRRAEALGCRYEGRLRGLFKPAEAGFVLVARPFMGRAGARKATTA